MILHIIESEDRDGLLREEMSIDGKEVLHVFPLCECPEDAIIGRNLISCNQIAALMQMAHEAGINKEPFRVEFETLNE